MTKTPDFRVRPDLTDDGAALSELVASAFDDLARTLAAALPEGRPMALVMTKLEEANQWAQALVGQAHAAAAGASRR